MLTPLRHCVVLEHPMYGGEPVTVAVYLVKIFVMSKKCLAASMHRVSWVAHLSPVAREKGLSHNGCAFFCVVWYSYHDYYTYILGGGKGPWVIRLSRSHVLL